MKNLKYVLSSLVVVALMSGLFIRGIKQNKEITKQEFLFDTLCSITVYSKKDAAAMDKAFETAAEIHHLADFWSDSSDTSKINNAKANEPVKVSPHTINMLTLSQEIFKKSHGAFDVTVAPVSHLWRFDQGNPTPPSDAQIKALLPGIDSNDLVLDTKTNTVTKKKITTQIDLGGIAKGYAADKAAEALKKMNVKSALIDFGGNIAAIGENPKTKNKKWRIGLQMPYAPTGEYSKIVEVAEGSIVTSGTYQRYFEHNGNRYHHIIDPKTGYPSKQGYDSVTVITSDAATADCLATAIYVLGKNQGVALAKEYNAEVYFLP